ncbi:hypothetical protein JR316_0000728 [Psilocybe cubensis]|uniref:Uncharacterized protein n=2 Tax=Psilocybe cubensis TaxID=181762 RepID=A0A8H7YA21_PSICU|nr:hypothetical protein JR316_0000728 [Psilocybe cubensis]KAH9486663.1 hypothetical protein JR316_0000728 [Psilocybe cubensis]
MMARATRSSTADLKRKRSFDNADNDEHASNKQNRTTDLPYHIDAHRLLAVLEAEDTLGLLDRVFPVPGSDDSASLRSLLTTSTSISTVHSAIQQLKPISSLPRARLSSTAEQQLRFCSLAHALLEQLPSTDIQTALASLPDVDSSPPRPKPSYALVQHLPAGDYWSSVLHTDDPPKNLHTANAELVAVLPTPSSSKDIPVPTLGSYSTKPLSPKKSPLSQRRVTASGFLDYGLYTSFAPSFDEDGEVVGNEQLGQVLWYREERKRLREIRCQHREETSSVVEITPELRKSLLSQDGSSSTNLVLESLLPPEDVESIKATLNSLELEKSVQTLLDRNQRALERLEELQFQRMTKHPTSNAEENSEEWETAQAILDSLTLLASLRPRSSSEQRPAIIPPASVLHKLHLTLSLEPSPGWYGTLPAGRSTALHDDLTVKVRPGAAIPTPVMSTPSTPASTSTANTYAGYSYAYPQQQQQTYRSQQAPTYTPYTPGQVSTYYQGYIPAGQQQQTYVTQQTYGTGTANQQPYGAAIGQQQITGYSQWYPQPNQASNGPGSGRGTPQPTLTTLPTNIPTSYGNFFNSTSSSTSSITTVTRSPAIANTVVSNVANVNANLHNQTPTQRHPQSPMVNGGSVYPAQQVYYPSYQMQTQPAR